MSDVEPPQPADIAAETALIEAEQSEKFGDQLRDENVGTRVVRGGGVRVIGYGLGSIAIAVASVLLLRYLGPAQFGSYSAVMAITTIVLGISDTGLNTVGNRELALCKNFEERRALLSELLGIRLILTPLCVLGAIAFTILADYPTELVIGTAIAGLGTTLATTSSSFALPLAVDLKIVSLTILDTLKQVAPTVVMVGLIAASADLLPFFAATIPGALAAILLTPRLAGRDSLAWPSFRFRTWWPLLRMAIPVAFASTIAVIYLRVLTLLMYELTTDFETGLFSTSVRVVELLIGIPWMVFSIALPVLSVANDEDRVRSHYVLQRMIDVGLVASTALSVTLCLAAPTIISILGGPEYDGAMAILQIQSFAIIAAFIVQPTMFAAIAIGMTRVLVFANIFGLFVIVAVGIPLITAWGGKGAGAATLLADSATAAAYWYMIGRGENGIRMSLRSVWKPALAGALAFLAGWLSGVPPLAQAAVALVVYVVVALATRAIPQEVFDAVPLRRGKAPG